MGVVPTLALAQAHQEGVSKGLIVRLKSSAREGQLQSGLEQDLRRQRLARLAVSAGYTSSMGWRSMGGRMAVMKTPSALKPEMARKLAAKMVATGEVEWVEPSVKQKLQAVPVPTAPSNDYYVAGMAGSDGQWWARAVAGSNSDAKSLRQRGAPNIAQAWNTTVGYNQSSGVVVAVLDTGYLPHDDLPRVGQPDAARLLPGYDFVSDTAFDRDGTPGRDSDPTDPGDWVDAAQASQSAFKALDCGESNSSWHGLAVSGIVAAITKNNGGAPGDSEGMAAVNWATRLLPVRVSGMCGADLDDIVDAIRWAAGLSSVGGVTNANPAKVINISFGSDAACGPAYQAVIDEVRAAGVVVVAAAGNEHKGVSRPANCRGVVSVAALNREGFKTTYSNFGPEVTVSTVGGDPGPSWVGAADYGAWGAALSDTGILTLYNSGTTTASGGSNYGYYAGTSFSAPIVAGVVALMLDVDPSLSPDDIIAGLKASARRHVQSSQMGTCSWSNPGRCVCTQATCGQGILDAAEAVRYAAAHAASTSYAPLSALAANIDTIEVAQAVAAAPADRSANPPATTSAVASTGGGGGGGGAMDGASLLSGLALMTVLTGRRLIRRRHASH
jgi:serine protease